MFNGISLRRLATISRLPNRPTPIRNLIKPAHGVQKMFSETGKLTYKF